MTYFRLLIACCTVTVLALSVPAHAAQEQSEELWLDLKDQLFDERTLHDGSDWLELDAPYRAMDAAIVPISVNVNREQNDDTYIKNLMIVIDENPSPLAAVINMSPTNGNASLDTRIRIDRYTHVRAIAEDNEGNLYTVARFVKGRRRMLSTRSCRYGSCQRTHGTDEVQIQRTHPRRHAHGSIAHQSSQLFGLAVQSGHHAGDSLAFCGFCGSPQWDSRLAEGGKRHLHE